MRSLIFISLIATIGCRGTDAGKSVLPAMTFDVNLAKIDSQSVEILVQTANIEGSISELATQQKRIADAVETLKASLVESEAQSAKEVINPSRTAPGKNPNDSQSATLIVAEPGAVRLIVSLAEFPCPPCDRLKEAVEIGRAHV